MNDGTAPQGGPGNLRRLQPNAKNRRRSLRCPDCGTRVWAQLLNRHRVEECRQSDAMQMSLDDELVAGTEGLDGWSVFRKAETRTP
jgi:hypothetical protein